MIAVADTLRGRSFTRVSDWSAGEWLTALDLADELKAARAAGEETPLLPGRTLGMIFQKPSTRTRVSFEVGITQLGGTGLYLAASDLQLGRGETIRDTAVVLSRYLDAIMIRTYAQADVEELARHASIPVINGLTDEEHPCQALADVMTIRERLGRLEGVRLAYIGDGNNVCVSLAEAVAAARPLLRRRHAAGYEPAARLGGGRRRPARGQAAGADVLYTDVWTSMGQEEERDGRLARPRAAHASTRSWSRSPRRPRSSSTASPRTTARRSPRTCSTARSRPSGTRPRTACTRRRRCWP